MPAVVSQPTITITSPQGPKAIANPLYNYTFHPQPSAFDFPPDDPVSSAIISCSLLVPSVPEARLPLLACYLIMRTRVRDATLTGIKVAAFHSTVRYPNAAGDSQPDLVNQQLSANAQA